MRVGITWLGCANVDRGIFNMKQSKDQAKGDNWEAHDFSVEELFQWQETCITALLTLGKRGKKVKKERFVYI